MSRDTFNTIGADNTVRSKTQSRLHSGLKGYADGTANISSQRDPARTGPICISKYLQENAKPEHTRTTANGMGSQRCQFVKHQMKTLISDTKAAICKESNT